MPLLLDHEIPIAESYPTVPTSVHSGLQGPSTSTCTCGGSGIVSEPRRSPPITTAQSILDTNTSFVEEPRAQQPKRRGKSLVLCFDGTLDQFDADNSNIVQFFSCLDKMDDNQKLYYQAGIGTYLAPQFITPFAEGFMKLVDAAIGWNLKSHIIHGYQFIMQNYEPGDRISIFGFSRGAYTARGLAGMLCAIGLLPRDNFQQVPFAYKIYTEGSDEEEDPCFARCMLFKETYSRRVDIEFLGLWDTVSSIGLSNNRLPFTTFNPLVKRVRHALALDERRVKFSPSIWHRGKQRQAVEHAGDPKIKVTAFRGRTRSQNDMLLLRELSVAEYFNNQGYDDVEEVWFAGCHGDIGGGAVRNEIEHSLARIPLRWMIKECIKADIGLKFIDNKLAGIGLYTIARAPPHSASLRYKELPTPFATPRLHSHGSIDSKCDGSECPDTSRTSFLKRTIRVTVTPALQTLSKFTRPHPELSSPSLDSPTNPHAKNSSLRRWGHAKRGSATRNEMVELLEDAEAPIHCELEKSKLWWILEALPWKVPYQTENGKWKASYRPHMGKPRAMPVPSSRTDIMTIKVHHSVKEKINAKPPPGRQAYKPQALVYSPPQQHEKHQGKWERLGHSTPNIEWVH